METSANEGSHAGSDEDQTATHPDVFAISTNFPPLQKEYESSPFMYNCWACSLCVHGIDFRRLAMYFINVSLSMDDWTDLRVPRWPHATNDYQPRIL